MTSSSDEILFETIGCAGLVTLNRQHALNAVTHDMLMRLWHQLEHWKSDLSIDRIIIKAARGRAFSAGGDIRHLYDRGIAGDPDYQFFFDEYRLNTYIKRYPKPYVALIDGIAMGGGVGISFHGSHRVAGENVGFAMPEVGIGFFPDVGASNILPHLPGMIGLYLGLTGTRVKQGDCLWSGLATHACHSADLGALQDMLSQPGDTDKILSKFSILPEPGELSARREWIDAAFSAANVEGIVARLKKFAAQQGARAEWAAKTEKTLLSKSPTSLKIAFRQIHEGSDLEMESCMQMEYRILQRVLAGREFYEGIRAAIIDKTGKPAWKPSSLDAVSQDEIDRIFSPLADGELPLP